MSKEIFNQRDIPVANYPENTEYNKQENNWGRDSGYGV
jgi:hypothetical protein